MVRKTQTNGALRNAVIRLENPSVQQADIFDRVATMARHIMVIAGAGCGKTSTMVEAVHYVQEGFKVAFIAFNKSIKEEMAARAPSHVDVYTYHGLGMRALNRWYSPRPRLDKNKLDKILRNLLPKDRYYKLVGTVAKLVRLAKNNLVSDPETILDLAEYHGMRIFDPDAFLRNITRYVVPAIRRCANDVETIDFDDMCWLGVHVGEVEFPKYDVVFVDEVQDTNPTQAAMLSKLVDNGAKLCMVGDPAQSIYSFRGADTRAVPNLIEKFDAEVLPLSVTYRCPVSHVALANEFVPELEAAPGAAEGVVNRPEYEQVPGLLSDKDMVLSRTTSSLVQAFLKTISLGKTAVLRGRDLGKNMIKLIDRQDAYGVPDLLDKLDRYCDKTVRSLLDRKKADLAQLVVDEVDAIHSLASGIRSVDDLIDRIRNVFSDDLNGIVFSTIHRAKGLEADVVWILRPDIMPHPMSKLDWELEQERNLEYVALTRAKCELNIVQGPYPPPRQNLAATVMDRSAGIAFNEVGAGEKEIE